MCMAYFSSKIAQEDCVSGLSLQILQVLTDNFFRKLQFLHGQSTDHDLTV